MRQLKHHEKKLLKKVSFTEWGQVSSAAEQSVISMYLLKSREEYKKYGRIASMIRALTESLVKLADNDATKITVAKKLITLLYGAGIIGNRRLLDCSKVTISSICQRRLPMVMCRLKLIEGFSNADKFVQQGHVRIGNRVVSDTSTLVSRNMEEFVGWVDNSRIRKKIDEFNGEYDDYKYV